MTRRLRAGALRGDLVSRPARGAADRRHHPGRGRRHRARHPGSAPVDAMIRRKMIWVTIATFALWLPLCAFILWGGVTVRDLDFFHRM